VVAVMDGEEAFGPGHDPRLPDVVLQFEDDVAGDNALGPEVVVRNGERGPHEGSGGHSREGVLIAAGDGVRPGRHGIQPIEGVASTILSYLGLTPPPEMAEVLSELFEPESLSASGDGSWSPPPGGRQPAVSPEEEEEILQSLRGLGYLE